MKKILSILPLILITGEAAAHTGTGSHEHPESNTVVIENTVEVFSSRQNVYLCNVAINSKRGDSYLADNRVYATAHRVSRRDSSKDLETPVVLKRVRTTTVDGLILMMFIKMISLERNQAFQTVITLLSFQM